MILGFAWPAHAAPPSRRIAITLDDLPGIAHKADLARLTEVNVRVLAALQAAHAPAIGFVNEERIQVPGERDARTALLNRWLDAGMTLGNHTFRHRDISKIPLTEYEDDVIRGEVVTRALVEARHGKLTYFRHPFTHTGPTAEVRQALEKFLAEHGYKTAPFTIEHSDFVFSAVYDDARARGDQAGAARIRAAYVSHFERTCAWFESLSRDVFGREIPQILLAHVNSINADALPELLNVLARRGYTFITLDEALADDAYRTPDLYVGPVGPSWLHRWSVAKKKPWRIREDPDPSAEIISLWQALRAEKAHAAARTAP